MKIGKIEIGIRKSCGKFEWFYHPLLPYNEKRYFVYYVWIGWHLYLCIRKDKNNEKEHTENLYS